MIKGYQTLARWRFHAFLYLLILPSMMVTPAIHAESLVKIEMQPSTMLLSEGKISGILDVQGRAVALGENYVWILDEPAGLWNALNWAAPKGTIEGIASDGTQSFLLLSDQNNLINRLESYQHPNTDSSLVTLLLPQPFIFAHAAFMQELLFIVGVSENGVSQLLSIDPQTVEPQWVSYGPLSVTGQTAVTSMVAQNGSLFITVSEPETGDHLLQWTLDTGWQDRSSVAGKVIPGAGRAIGQGHVLYIVKELSQAKKTLKLVSFHTITGAWADYGDVTTTTVRSVTSWKNGFLWNQAGIGGTGAEFSSLELETGKHLLHVVDWAVIGFYLFSMLGVGLYFYTRQGQNSKSDFFLGGRAIPFWAAGISLYASNASSISYIAVPAKAFATNWQYLMSNIIVVVGLIFVAIWVVPLIRRLNLMSIFQYLETRFHPAIRLLSSALFIVFQLGGRMTIILFLPSLAISTVTGIDVTLSILIMGGITIIYTVLGGMKAVIWTDVMQLFVMFGGAIFAIIYMFMMLDGGVAEFLATSMADNKMKMVDWSFNLTEATVWGFIFLVFFDTVLTFPKDQVLMQRVLSTGTAKDAGRSVWVFALIIIPGSIMFYLVGTALYAFYQSHPERMDPSLSIDATFPLFIAAELPIGVTGLIIAGIFAASMSTLSSILNSVATLTTVDFYEKIVGKPNEKDTVRFAVYVTIVAGLIGIGLALLLSMFEINSLLDLALELWGLLGGGFAGAYTLGMFTRRSNWQGVGIGVTVSIAATLAAWSVNLVHPYFYLPFSVMICIVVGYAASLLFPPPRDLHGLTVFKEDTIS